jgi:hypothetical protein
MSRRSHGSYTIPMLAAALFLGACTPPIRQWDLRNRPITCDDANRFAFKSLKAMGFTITGVEPASYGAPGALHGKRQRGSQSEQVTVRIRCSADGATLDIRDDRQLVDQVDLKRAFFMSFTNVESITAAAEAMEKQIAAGTAPDSQQRHDLQVEIEPVPGQGAKLHFGLDLAAAGVLPVRIRMANHTPRAYTLDPAALVLSRADRQRTRAMTVEEAARRIVAARDAKRGEPLTALPADVITAKLAAEQFRVTELEPGGQGTGFLYFPLAGYRGARMVLTDVSSGESEGVVVDFQP